VALSRLEKLILSNQYEILKRVDPESEKHYQVILEALRSGYESDFYHLIGTFDESTSDETMVEVRDILEMFRALDPAPRTGAPSAPAARFVGFGGNEESAHMAYAAFLMDDRGLWRESKRDDYNTHCPVLPEYRRMLERWRAARDKFNLTADEMREIAALAPYGATEPANT
jgi:uncharacterized protein YfbU (UPF0304 family)